MSLARLLGGTEKQDLLTKGQKRQLNYTLGAAKENIAGSSSLISDLATNRESSYDLASDPQNNLDALFQDIDTRNEQAVGNVLHSNEMFSSGNKQARLMTEMNAGAQKNQLQYDWNERRRQEEMTGLESMLGRQASLAQGWANLGLQLNSQGLGTRAFENKSYEGFLPQLGKSIVGGIAGATTGGIGSLISNGFDKIIAGGTASKEAGNQMGWYGG